MPEFLAKYRRLLVVTAITLLPACDSDGEIIMADVPDLTQTLVAGSAHNDGQMYCAPVAVSNSLVWLLGERNQVAVAKKLASSAYMNTSLKNGTGTTGVLRGVAKYLGSRNIEPSSLLYQGWRKHLRRFGSGEKRPDPQFLKQHVGEGKAAWLNVGWYKKDGPDYRRVGGHWVTLIGYSTKDAGTFYLNDPSPRAGWSSASNEVTVNHQTDLRI